MPPRVGHARPRRLGTQVALPVPIVHKGGALARVPIAELPALAERTHLSKWAADAATTDAACPQVAVRHARVARLLRELCTPIAAKSGACGPIHVCVPPSSPASPAAPQQSMTAPQQPVAVPLLAAACAFPSPAREPVADTLGHVAANKTRSSKHVSEARGAQFEAGTGL